MFTATGTRDGQTITLTWNGARLEGDPAALEFARSVADAKRDVPSLIYGEIEANLREEAAAAATALYVLDVISQTPITWEASGPSFDLPAPAPGTFH
jgi:hypothetical protein